MHASLQALFDEHATPTHATGDDIRAALKPILAIGARLNKQMAVYREHHLNAKLDAHDPGFDSMQEQLRQRFAAAETRVANFIDAGEKLADVMANIESVMAQTREYVANYEAVKARGTPGA